MELKEKLLALADRAEKIITQIKTEEGTKQSLILPFFQILGYDVFNPLEFCPEFDADYGIKKGEKVDYAIIIDNVPTILVEAKCCNDKLDRHGAQLFRYFNTSKAKFGVLTNGIKYRFFTDLDETNKMDEKPFFEVDLFNLTDNQISYITNFHRKTLDVDSILTSASDLKYSNLIKDYLKGQLTSTSEDLASFLVGQVYEGRKTSSVIEKFIPVVNKSLNQFINETMSSKFAETLKGPSIQSSITEEVIDTVDDSSQISKIVTTATELEAFAIIKSMIRSLVDPSNITYKDTESYFGVLFQNNTRKWICRLFLGTKKSIVLPIGEKGSERFYIDSIDDLYNYEAELKEVIQKYI